MPLRIIPGQLPYTGGTGIEIDANKVISLMLREENNLILVNDENEIYTDLQLVNNIKPTDEFPVGVTVGKILQSNGWTQSGLLLNRKTTSGDYARWIYANDGKIYFDQGTGVWKQVYYSSEVDTMIQSLTNYVDIEFQPKLTAGTGINIDQNNVISTTGSGSGDVVGPNGATDGNIAVFDGATGKVIKDGGPVPTPTTVVDALDSTSTTDALSANQGRILDGKIADLMSLGKFLSLWDSTTGQPLSFPYATPYAYTTGDYFLVENISSANPPVNYKPDGSSYTGTASSVTESDEVEVGDVYIYDGTIWLLQSNHGKTVAFANIAGQPSDNTNLANALNDKQGVWIEVTVSTGATTSAKVGTTTGGSYSPTKGDFLLVNFVNGCYVNSPTLNVDGSGAKNIKIGDVSANGDNFNLGSTGNSNVKVLLYYDGSVYRAWSTENTKYDVMSTSEGKTGTSTTARSITASNLKQIIKYLAVDDTAYGSGWDGQTDIAPSKNAVYDKIQSIIAGLVDIQYVTQAEYTALLPGALTDNKHYFIYSTSGGGGRQPGANTLAYYTLDNDLTNQSTATTKFSNITQNTATFSTTKAHGTNTYSLYCDGSTYAYIPASALHEFGTNDFTISCWVYSLSNTNGYRGFISNYTNTIGDTDRHNTYSGYRISDRFGGSSELNFCWVAGTQSGVDWFDGRSGVSLYNAWHNVVVTRSSGVLAVYLDGNTTPVITETAHSSNDIGKNSPIYFGLNSSDNACSKVYLNDVIFESKARTAQEVSDYYTQTA